MPPQVHAASMVSVEASVDYNGCALLQPCCRRHVALRLCLVYFGRKMHQSTQIKLTQVLGEHENFTQRGPKRQVGF